MLSIQEYSRIVRKAKRSDKLSEILQICSHQNVLDIGCVGQDVNYESPDWLHNQIRSVAKSLQGVDIVTQQIEKLNNKGYKIIHYNELIKTSDLYDVIIMADVIEHVDNPVSFISDYAKFLEPHGKIVITTPNAKRAVDFINILWGNNFWVNEEHTMWLCPYTTYEIIRRSKLDIENFLWLKNHIKVTSSAGVKSYLLNVFANILMFFWNKFSPNFLIVLKKN